MEAEGYLSASTHEIKAVRPFFWERYRKVLDMDNDHNKNEAKDEIKKIFAILLYYFNDCHSNCL